MKYSVLIIALVFNQLAYAGSPNCSGTTQLTAAGDYLALTSDCTISNEKTFFEPTSVDLPSSPSIGDEFTVQDNTSYTLDDCEDYGDPGAPLVVCNPAGVTISAADATVDGSESVTLSGYYYQYTPSRQRVKFVFDGSDWNATYSNF